MIAVKSLGVPWQLTTEYRARAGGMRVHTTGVGTREESFSGLKIAKNLDNAEKSRIFLHFEAIFSIFPPKFST